MSETKHTPGALRAADLIAALLRVPECDRDGQRAAVAQLIDNETAAPELLEALRRVIEVRDERDKVLIVAQSAIDKAEGRS